jgi:hypothetical protein
MDKFEKEMLEKIDSTENLTERELRDLLECELEDERDDYDERRWVMNTYSIIKLGDRFFGLNWDRGLTEMQENEFYQQPEEVLRTEREVTETIVEWKVISKEGE